MNDSTDAKEWTPYEILMAFFEKFGRKIDFYDFRIVSSPPEPTRYQIKARHYETYEWCPKKNHWWKQDGRQ